MIEKPLSSFRIPCSSRIKRRFRLPSKSLLNLVSALSFEQWQHLQSLIDSKMAELFSGKMLWRFFGPHNRRLDELGTSTGHGFLIEHHILSSIRELQHTSNILSVIFEWKSWCFTASKISRYSFCSMLVTKIRQDHA